ncbi:MAG TPA: protein-L-isoaspartate(D-aspartate) O-methyltransferase [Candidatus Krumholzibacteria bacterium]
MGARTISAVLLLGALAMPSGCRAQDGKSDKDMTQERNDMVRSQIQARGVTDARVLQAMCDVKRHLFVPGESAEDAYEDYPLPIGEGQTISQPYIVALMSELLELDDDDRVLEIGTGSGYQAAILARLAHEVYSMEIVPSLGEAAAKRLDLLGYENVQVKIGDGYKGWPEHAPYDAIMVTAAPPEVPQALVDQLADGGRMVVPVGTNYQELLLITKHDGDVARKVITAVRFVPMVKGKEEKKK